MTLLITGLLGCSKSDKGDNHSDEIGNRKSPIAIASIKSNGTYIKVVYGQPYRRGRVIFGELLPWGELWRTGANEATEITITEPVLIDTESVRAGTYSLFTIPEPDSLTLILNYDLGLWGVDNYNSARDYKRIKVPAKHLDDAFEALTIEFSETNYSTTKMILRWDTYSAEIPIRFFGE